ncbi:hypothetical protein GCM10023188_30520 [Pontibacter saemangeumensis]|uniref:UspA domain-containing protein n=1 Tax=Pontibacter saemangeumensis TaxID=1084525 RepID=A0ABP8LU07_9BACT
MKTILVPTDFSQDAHDTLLYATEIASVTGSKIVLFHAFYQPLSLSYSQDFTTAVNELERERTEELEAYAERFKAYAFDNFSVRFQSTLDTGVQRETPVTKSGFHHVEVDNAAAKRAGVDIRCVCKFGFAFDEILKAVDVHRADLVVMGMRGEGALRRALLGRTTINVMRDAKVPVLAVPLGCRFMGFEAVVFAADLFKLPPNTVFEFLRGFVKQFASRLQILHLYHENSLQQEKEKALASLDILDRQLFDINYKVVFQKEKDFAEGVTNFVQEQQASLLVLVPQKHPFLEELLSRSLTQKIMAKAFLPLLALPAVGVESTSAAEVKVVEEHQG